MSVSLDSTLIALNIVVLFYDLCVQGQHTTRKQVFEVSKHNLKNFSQHWYEMKEIPQQYYGLKSTLSANFTNSEDLKAKPILFAHVENFIVQIPRSF